MKEEKRIKISNTLERAAWALRPGSASFAVPIIAGACTILIMYAFGRFFASTVLPASEAMVTAFSQYPDAAASYDAALSNLPPLPEYSGLAVIAWIGCLVFSTQALVRCIVRGLLEIASWIVNPKKGLYAARLFPRAKPEKRELIMDLADANAIRSYDWDKERYIERADVDELFDRALGFICASKLYMRGWLIWEEPRRGLFIFHNPRKEQWFNISVAKDGSTVTAQYIEGSQEHIASSIEEAIKKYQIADSQGGANFRSETSTDQERAAL